MAFCRVRTASSSAPTRSAITIRPPGAQTRAMSPSTSEASPKWWIAEVQVTSEKDPSANGRCSATPRTSRAAVPESRARACCSIATVTSSPTVNRTRGESTARSVPGPHATSRARSSGALHDTIAACREAGISSCGAGGDLEEALAPARLRAGGVEVALISVACTLPIESAARPGKAGIAPIEVIWSLEPDLSLTPEQPGTMPVVRTRAAPVDQQRVCDRVAQLSAGGRTVIVGIHWGVPEHWLCPATGRLAEYQRPLGHALIDAGAALVFGHHSHSLHPIEAYRGRAIVYSAGNFLFEDPRPFMAPESVIVQLALGPRPAVTLVPAILDAEGFPQLATGDAARRVLDWVRELSRDFGTAFDIVGDRARVVFAHAEKAGPEGFPHPPR